MTAIEGIPSSHPGLEIRPGGRTLLQERLFLHGAVMAVFDLLFTAGFYCMWSLEPSVGPELAASLVTSPGVVGLALTLLVLALTAKLVKLSPRALRNLDLATHSVIGLALTGIALGIPLPVFGMFEALLGLSAILCARAILLPSSARFTLLVSVLACTPSTITVLGWASHFTAGSVAPHTVRTLFVGRCVLVIAISVVASAVVYRLRREVRHALRLGQYTLEERLGEGGMGVVYRARHAMLRRPTAVKLLLKAQDGSLERFEREAQLTANLTHPNSIVVHDYGKSDDGILYYAMEYLDGIDLEELVNMDGPQPPERVVHLLRQACGALSEAHSSGLIHRDIKPANLFLCRRASDPDFLKVLDFGLVKHLATVDATLTGAPAMVGTPQYMAPEAFSAPADVGPTSDLYALGAVAFRLLTGQHLFAGATFVEVCAHHLYTPAPTPSARGVPVPRELEAAILRCLEKSPADRFESAEALDSALVACGGLAPWGRSEAIAWWSSRARSIAERRAHRARLASGTERSLIRALAETRSSSSEASRGAIGSRSPHRSARPKSEPNRPQRSSLVRTLGR
jgi:eukaryotic-like serine/threonine-protein kinase